MSDSFETEMERVALAARLICDADLDKLRATCERAETLGPILTPDDYRDGAGRLASNRRVIDAAIAFRAVIRDLADREGVDR